MTQITAAAGKAIVVIDKADTTIGSQGLVLPDQAQKPSKFATVVDSKIVDVEAGDRLVLSAYAGADFDVDGVTYTAILPDEILGVIG